MVVELLCINSVECMTLQSNRGIVTELLNVTIAYFRQCLSLQDFFSLLQKKKKISFHFFFFKKKDFFSVEY